MKKSTVQYFTGAEGPMSCGSFESGWPTPRSSKHAEDAHFSGLVAIDENVWSSQDDALASSGNSAQAPGARKSGKKRNLFVNTSLDEFRDLFAFFCDVCRQFHKIGHGGLAPDQPHALRFNFLALRIAS
jgi:hypothetical protein